MCIMRPKWLNLAVSMLRASITHEALHATGFIVTQAPGAF